MVYVFIENDEFINEKVYTFDLFFDILGIEYSRNIENIKENDLLIVYAEENNIEFQGKKLFIKSTKILFNQEYLKKLPIICPYRYKLEKEIDYIKDIIILLKCETPEIIQKNRGIYLNIDVISNAFYLVSRYEEYINKERDSHKRFSYKSSAICTANAVDRPIINEYIELVYSLMNKLDNNIVKGSKWDDKDYVICISHDIDSILKYRDKFLKAFLVKLIKERNIKEAFNKVKNYIMSLFNYQKDPYWTFDYLMNLEEKYSFTSSYYFMTSGETNKDNSYSINNTVLKKVFNRIKANDSEIGIHGSYNSYNNVKCLKKEIDLLSKYTNVDGIRQHYLRFSIEETWKTQIENNIKYDTTLAFADTAGFRAGICSPFRPFDLKRKVKLDIWEIPLIVMDGTLMERGYLNLSCDQAVNFMKVLIDRIKYHNGVFSLLWHNSSFDYEGEWKGWQSVYEEILKYAYETNAKGLSGIKLIMKVEDTI